MTKLEDCHEDYHYVLRQRGVLSYPYRPAIYAHIRCSQSEQLAFGVSQIEECKIKFVLVVGVGVGVGAGV
jgi:hypothetical protein